MKLEHRPDKASLASAAAEHLLRIADAVIAERGSFHVALSGGSTPWVMLDAAVALRGGDASAFDAWRVYQVDERAAPDGHGDRNWTHVRAHLLTPASIAAGHAMAMPVLDPDRDAAAMRYASALPERLDMVQLGIGDDGHTASLVPNDSILTIEDRDVAWTGEDYRGYPRMSLTYAAIAKAHNVMWLLAGTDKKDILDRVVAGDPTLPASKVGRGVAFVSV